MPNWEQIRKQVTPFKNGLVQFAPESDEFKQEAEKFATREDPWKETALMVTDKFALVAVQNRHVEGVHLVLHPRGKYWKEKGGFSRPW